MADNGEETRGAGGGCWRGGGSAETGEVVAVSEEEGGELVGVGRGSVSMERREEMTWLRGGKREC